MIKVCTGVSRNAAKFKISVTAEIGDGDNGIGIEMYPETQVSASRSEIFVKSRVFNCINDTSFL